MENGDVLAGRYRLERVLGRGGMGAVWLGRDETVLDRDVAVKVLHETSADPTAARRFRKEAATLAGLQHPGITVVHDAGSHEGHLFLVMELLHGADLARLTARHPRGLPFDTVFGLSRQTAQALAAAHAGGVIHRDLKPANLFLQDDGRVKICDFGIARGTDTVSTLTESGRVVGTPAYMSPEQCRDLPLDTRSDMYALGCVMYELLTGEPPFTARQPLYALLRQHAEVPAPPVAGRRPDVPGPLADLVAALLAKDPRDRPDARALAAALTTSPAPAPPARGPLATTRRDVPTALREPPSSAPARPTGFTLLTALPVPGGVRALAVSPDGRTVAGAGQGVRLWDIATGELRREVSGWHGKRLTNMSAVAFSPDGGLLAATRADKLIRLWNTHTGEPERDLRHGGPLTTLRAVAFSPDGRLLASGGSGPIRLWDLRAGVLHRTLRNGSDDVNDLVFSPNGKTLAGVSDGHVFAWDTVTGERLFSLMSPRSPFRALAFSPDGGSLASAGVEQFHLRDAVSGERRRTFAGLTGARGAKYQDALSVVECVTFSPDGTVLAGGGNDRAVRLWDPATGAELAALTAAHTATVSGLAFTPDGRTLASASGTWPESTGELCLWRATP
ncbi:WD40 repeat domain-containing serine/threonine protein kinase [Streptomyces sp. NPDC004031]